MGKMKLVKEIQIMTGFAIAVFVLALGSGIFLYASIQRDEMGGLIISSMLLFISCYALIVFLARLRKYNKVKRVQSAILKENITDIELLQEKFSDSRREVVKKVKFLIDNGYLEGYFIHGNHVVSKEQEREAAVSRANKEREILELKYQQEKEKLLKSRENKQKEAAPIRVECPSCGAVNLVEESTELCVYCGNVLKKNK